MKLRYQIELTPEADTQVAGLRARDRAALLDGILLQLTHQPTVETRNRGRLRPNPLASYRLRVGQLRVYYDVDEAARLVTVRTIGVKVRNRVLVAGKEIRF